MQSLDNVLLACFITQACTLCTTCRFGLQEAKSLGLVLDVAEPDQLMSAATDLARLIAGMQPRHTARMLG